MDALEVVIQCEIVSATNKRSIDKNKRGMGIDAYFLVTRGFKR